MSDWRKSTWSAPQGECVELRCEPGRRLVRDSKNPSGPRLEFGEAALARMLTAVRVG